MKANELRIGNWVQHEPYPEEKWLIDFKLLEAIDLELVECEGIPLSPDVLKACGFELSEDLGDMQYYQIPNQTHGYGVEFDHDDIVFYHFRGEDCNVLIYDEIHFQYLHQLQNLFYSLTGKELE